jgi:excisionase family DNA binding protein
MQEKQYLTVKETAETINVSNKLIYKMVLENKIPFTKICNKILIPQILLNEWLDKKTAKA